ncbi:hypothetical protein [Bradyrhizobium sp. SBR1B]|uniref:hypothetical protein n=1 Tax=Bradyrhizobium sp. SBR1B TaxID=2663836 RepID=UPI001605AB3F|nr:hypothetical protein [Bradyrhizobium sp. SBR1B]MBB4380276.1 hypothetical protein [Bradyrhizobium sp. SBR1B]
MDERRIPMLRQMIEDQIEAVAAAICEGNSVLEAVLRLEWLTRELVRASHGPLGFSDRSVGDQMWYHYRWACPQPHKL